MSGLVTMVQSTPFTPAQQALIEKYRYINVEWGNWWDYVEEGFKERMKAEGIEVAEIFFSGFYSQGDGACFNGRLINPELYLDRNCAGEYPMIRRLLRDGGSFVFTNTHTGRYYHHHSTTFDYVVDAFRDVLRAPSELQEEIIAQWDRQLDAELEEFAKHTAEHWRGYMQELYGELEDEHDDLTSDTAVWETIEANGLDEPEEEGDDV